MHAGTPFDLFIETKKMQLNQSSEKKRNITSDRWIKRREKNNIENDLEQIRKCMTSRRTMFSIDLVSAWLMKISWQIDVNELLSMAVYHACMPLHIYSNFSSFFFFKWPFNAFALCVCEKCEWTRNRKKKWKSLSTCMTYDDKNKLRHFWVIESRATVSYLYEGQIDIHFILPIYQNWNVELQTHWNLKSMLSSWNCSLFFHEFNFR